MKKKDLLTQEFIGKNITIIKSPTTSLKGFKGKIIDETKFTFIIEKNKKRKTIIKNQIEFTIDNNKTKIYGNEISKRPEDRLKMRIKNE